MAKKPPPGSFEDLLAHIGGMSGADLLSLVGTKPKPPARPKPPAAKVAAPSSVPAEQRPQPPRAETPPVARPPTADPSPLLQPSPVARPPVPLRRSDAPPTQRKRKVVDSLDDPDLRDEEEGRPERSVELIARRARAVTRARRAQERAEQVRRIMAARTAPVATTAAPSPSTEFLPGMERCERCHQGFSPNPEDGLSKYCGPCRQELKDFCRAALADEARRAKQRPWWQAQVPVTAREEPEQEDDKDELLPRRCANDGCDNLLAPNARSKTVLCPECQTLQQKEKTKRKGARSHTLSPKEARLTQEERELAQTLETPDVERPKTRGDCQGGERPCPFVSCKHHLYLDINPETGSIKLNFPDLEPWELRDTCALDVADRGGITLEAVGEIFNLTRERIRQVEVRGLAKLKEGDVDGTATIDDRLAEELKQKLRRAGVHPLGTAANAPSTTAPPALPTRRTEAQVRADLAARGFTVVLDGPPRLTLIHGGKEAPATHPTPTSAEPTDQPAGKTSRSGVLLL